MDLSYVHIRYFIRYVYHICLQDTIQSTQWLCLLCQAMLLPMPLRPLLLTTRSGLTARDTSRIHDCKKREKTTGLILTYFLFGLAALANLADRLLATELPPMGEATVPGDR